VKRKRPLRKKDLPNVSGIHRFVCDMLFFEKQIIFVVNSAEMRGHAPDKCVGSTVRVLRAHLAPEWAVEKFNSMEHLVYKHRLICVTSEVSRSCVGCLVFRHLVVSQSRLDMPLYPRVKLPRLPRSSRRVRFGTKGRQPWERRTFKIQGTPAIGHFQGHFEPLSSQTLRLWQPNRHKRAAEFPM